jgi:uncharacterized protein YndB with AHSA1/START domain
MAPIVHTIEVARSAEEVFSYVTDPLRFPEWQADVVSVRPEGAGPSGLGWRFTTIRRVGGAERAMTQQVTKLDPPKAWAVQGVGGPIRPNGTVTIEPLEGGARSRVTFELDFEGHGLGVPLVPFIRRQAEKGGPASYHKLRELLDSGA